MAFAAAAATVNESDEKEKGEGGNPPEEASENVTEQVGGESGVFRFSDPQVFASLFQAAGLDDISVEAWVAEVGFPSFNQYFAWIQSALKIDTVGLDLDAKKAGLWKDLLRLAPALTGKSVVCGELSGDDVSDQANLPLALPCSLNVAIGYNAMYS